MMDEMNVLNAPKKVVDGLTEVFEGLAQMFEGVSDQLELLGADAAPEDKRIFPAVNIMASSTRRDDLLHDRTTLDRMWILRKFISDRNPVEAMSFVRDRLDRSRSIEEFLASMNS